MKNELVEIKLPEGRFRTYMIAFSPGDQKPLWNLYQNWRNLCDELISLHGRSVNLPEALSESAVCLDRNLLRKGGSIAGANSSFDAYDVATNKRIQIKACSVLPDLTSFGPTSEWDILYFVDFYRQGKWDGKFDIYHIPNGDIYGQRVNSTETVRDQQKSGKRPRFSIYTEIVRKKSLRPVSTGDLRS